MKSTKKMVPAASKMYKLIRVEKECEIRVFISSQIIPDK